MLAPPLALPLAFSPDGRLLLGLSGGEQNSLRLIDTTSGETQALLMQDRMLSVDTGAFHPDGTRVIAVINDDMRVWETASATLLGSLAGSGEDPAILAFDSSGSFVVIGDRVGTARIWELPTTERPARLVVTLPGDGQPLDSATFSPDDRRLLLLSKKGHARLFAIGELFAFEPAPVVQLGELIDGNSPIRVATFSAAGTIVTVSGDYRARIWTPARDTAATLHGSAATLNARFSADGNLIVAVAEDGTIRSWERTSGNELEQRRIDLDAGSATFGLTTIVVSPDLRHAVVTALDNTATLWDIPNGQRIALLEGHTAPLRRVAFSGDGTRLITASADGTARIWEMPGGQLLHTLDHDQPIVDAALNADGSVAVTIGLNNLRVWSAAYGGLTRAVVSTPTFIKVALSPDGTHFVLAKNSDGGTVAEIWKVQEPALQSQAGSLGPVRLAGHAQGINALAFSPDGALVATASDDGTVWLWDATSGSPLTVLRSHTGPVLSVAFSPDGRQVLSASDDGTIKVYPIRSADLLAVAACRAGRSLSNEELSRFEVPTELHLDLSLRPCLPRSEGSPQ